MVDLHWTDDNGQQSRLYASTFYQRHGKRLFDTALALLLLPIIAPVIALLWLLVRRDGGPGFFGHTRLGQNGRPFKCWKLRSMVVDAQSALDQHLADNPDAAAEWSRDFKLRNDPRITRIGNFLRRSSLDELPQIFNVLKGEMSFVGPRPVIKDEVAQYGDKWARCFALRPGITGLWQISGRNETSYDARVALDMEYARRCSLRLDMKIIVLTGLSVLRMTGK